MEGTLPLCCQGMREAHLFSVQPLLFSLAQAWH